MNQSMNLQSPNPNPARRGFTLIEMLVVIAIIVLIAGMVIPLAGLAAKKKKIAQAQAELKVIELAIDQYHNKKGFYPPDNTNSAGQNQLFYELLGPRATVDPGGGPTIYTNNFSGRDTIDTPTITAVFSAGGIVNSSPDPTQLQNFIPNLSPSLVKQFAVGANTNLWVFGCPSAGPASAILNGPAGPVNPIRYNSSNPTNNPNTYDLWVDIIIGGVTNRISNWSTDPQVVP